MSRIATAEDIQTALHVGAAAISQPQSAFLNVPVPDGFAHEDALLQLVRLIIPLLEHGMPEREIAKRLMRYHPLVEGA